MAVPSIKLRWIDPNRIEEGHKIYRSLTPMDVNNMPEPIAVLGKNETTYDDFNVVEDQMYYYRVSAFNNTINEEYYSAEIYTEVMNNIDIFEDGSIIAYYKFDNNLLDSSVNEYHGSESAGSVVYTTGLKDDAAYFDVDTYINTGIESVHSELSISFWVKSMENAGIFTCKSITFFNQGNGDILVWYYRTGTDQFYRYNSALSTILNDTNWNHVVVNLYSNSSIDVFINNNRISLTRESLTNATGTYGFSDINIGGYDATYGSATATLDEFRIFNRPITATEVDILYQDGNVL